MARFEDIVWYLPRRMVRVLAWMSIPLEKKVKVWNHVRRKKMEKRRKAHQFNRR